MELDMLRDRIDVTDRELLRLFKQRMELVRRVAEYKASHGLPVYQPQREQELLDRVAVLAGEDYAGSARMLFTAIMDISKALQHTALAEDGALDALLEQAVRTRAPAAAGASVACQGVRGAYSYLAAAHLVSQPQRHCFERFSDVRDAVLDGRCRYGVLPLENSSAGSVGEVYDLLSLGGLYIVKAYDLSVSHCLLGVPGARLEQVRRVYSHPQALSQCGDFFAANRSLEAVACANTAVAAQEVAQRADPAEAALAHGECAALYGLNILLADVQSAVDNRTRFILVSKSPEVPENASRIALMLKTAHTPGALYRVMSRFAARGFNITKIESRPIPEQPFEFMFFFEFDGSVAAEEVRLLLQSLGGDCVTFRFLGNYPLG